MNIHLPRNSGSDPGRLGNPFQDLTIQPDKEKAFMEEHEVTSPLPGSTGEETQATKPGAGDSPQACGPEAAAPPDAPSTPPVPEEKPRGGKNRMVLLLALVGVVLVAGALAYFLHFGAPGKQILATVNGEKITVDDFNRDVDKIESPLKEMLREKPAEYIQQMVLKKLLLQEAKKSGISAPAKAEKNPAKDGKDAKEAEEVLAPEDAMIVELMKKKFSAPPEVKPEEIEEFYNTFKERLGGRPLKEIAPAIVQIIGEAKRKEMLDKYVRDLHGGAKIEVKEDLMKKIAAKPPESNTDTEFKNALGTGKPILVDFGGDACVPCRQMRPVLKEIEKEVTGKARVLVLDVYKYQSLARDYKVQVIPTLVFFDLQGKEVFRHVGILEKEKIIAKFKEIGMAN
jgi:thioredoxin 1